MHTFKTYHPLVNFLYFLCVIGFSMVLMQPVFLVISLLGSFVYAAHLSKDAKKRLLFMVPAFCIMALINPLISHEGATAIAYFPGGKPLTLEAVLYGAASAAMLLSILSWFSAYTKIVTSDKFLYLFGRIIPSLSLVLSMTLRFVPAFRAQLAETVRARRGIGHDVSRGSLIKRAKVGLLILSSMATWAMESAIETADSMRARGYGIQKRTAFSVFTFGRRDARALLWILLLAFYTAFGYFRASLAFSFFPYLGKIPHTLYAYSVYLSYFALCLYPVALEWREERRWNTLKLKI